jgi:hypothetical protein
VRLPFLRRRKDAGESSPATSATASARQAVPFEGLTEEWRLTGIMHVDTRLSDVLNRREAIEISDVSWAPIDGSAQLESAPGLKSIDPYDLIVVLAVESTLPPLSDAEKVAYKVHKVAYDVALEVPPFRVVGTVYLYPGSEPERLLDRSTEMFLPAVNAVATHDGRPLHEGEIDAVLVNRFYLRGVEQVDRRTGERHVKLPGAPLGGVSWQDRSR